MHPHLNGCPGRSNRGNKSETMKTKVLLAIGLCVVAVALVIAFHKKPKTATVDPAFRHSSEAVVLTIREQQALLNEAAKKRDLRYIHDNMYYLETLAVALSRKVSGEKRAQVDTVLAELKRTTEEIDHWAGRKNQATTEAGLQKLESIIKELDALFATLKK